MSRRQTLGALSPGALNSRQSSANMLGPSRTGKQDGAAGGPRQSLKPGAGRPSMAPPRPSEAMDPRRSSAFGKGGNSGVKADPRPLGNKEYFSNCLKTVIAYLSTHGYPYAVSPKLLASPTGKDFAQIVQFLFSKFDPNQKAFGKVEDEVPLFFKRLNYPFAISKSALFAVGSPHSWPSVLAALTWLVELLDYEDRAEDGAAAAAAVTAASFDDKQRSEKEFYAYVSSSYGSFLAGDDHKCAAADAAMLGQFGDREGALQQELERLKQANAQLKADVEQLRSLPSPLVLAQQRRAECIADRSKFGAVIENQSSTKASLAKKLAERNADVAARKQQLAEVLKENEDLQGRIASQTLSKTDVNRMVAERTKQKEILESVLSQREELQTRLYQQEVEAEAALSGLEDDVRCYNLLADRLALVPLSAKRSGGIAYEIAVDRAAPAGRLINVDLKGTVKPGLARLREDYRSKGRNLAEDALGLGEALDALKEGIAERAEDNAHLEAQVRKLEADHRSVKEAMDADARATESSADKIQAEVSSLRNAMVARLAENEERLAAVAAEYEALSRSCANEVEALSGQMNAALGAMLQHRLDVRDGLAALKSRVCAAAAEVASMPEPAVCV